MFGGGLNPNKMGKQVHDMQRRLQEVEEDLKERIVEGSSGGGIVKVKVSGAQEIVAVSVDEQALASGDKAMVEDLFMTAANEGLKKAKKLRETELTKVTGFNLPGLV